MDVVKSFCFGLLSVLNVTSRPLLYRYPYRTSAEGLRSDWQRIASDVDSVIGKVAKEAEHGRN